MLILKHRDNNKALIEHEDNGLLYWYTFGELDRIVSYTLADNSAYGKYRTRAVFNTADDLLVWWVYDRQYPLVA